MNGLIVAGMLAVSSPVMFDSQSDHGYLRADQILSVQMARTAQTRNAGVRHLSGDLESAAVSVDPDNGFVEFVRWVSRGRRVDLPPIIYETEVQVGPFEIERQEIGRADVSIDIPQQIASTPPLLALGDGTIPVSGQGYPSIAYADVRWTVTPSDGSAPVSGAETLLFNREGAAIRQMRITQFSANRLGLKGISRTPVPIYVHYGNVFDLEINGHSFVSGRLDWSRGFHSAMILIPEPSARDLLFCGLLTIGLSLLILFGRGGRK